MKNKKEKWDGRSRVSNDVYRKRYDEIFKERVMEGKDPFVMEQEELKQSYEQSLRNKKEREKNRYSGSVNFQEEGDFIFCTRCKDNTIHQPTFGKCMKCGLEEYNEKQ
jgi:RNA polymerase-binding transcription factor DksA